ARASGRQACRAAAAGAHQVPVRDQPQDRAGAGPRCPARPVCPRRRGDRMRRREFIGLVGGAAVWPLAVRAQQSDGRVYKIGYLQIASREQTVHLIKGLEEGLGKLGYRVGENAVIEYRFANGDMQKLPALAADLVRLGVDIIVTGNNANTVAAMKATATIPIVMTVSVDPVGA